MKKLTDLQKGILKRALNGNEQTYEDVCRRVSTYLEGGETLYETMLNGEFLPAMPCLMNAGTDHPQLSACFVIPTEDSLESIMQSATEMALTFKSGGGVGFNLSFIRPKGSPVGSTGGTSPSIVEWMKMYNSVADAVKNGARRRGALMVCCNFWNPNIIDFINSKRVDGELSNMNISVVMTDSDFEAIDNDAKHPSGRTSRQVWNLIVTRAWENAEPGLLFLDRALMDDPRVYGTNPCGEQWLPPYGNCNLGSVNLSACIEDGQMNYEKLERITGIGARALCVACQKNELPLPQMMEENRRHPRIGLGVVGLAEAFIKCGIRYGTPYSCLVATNWLECMRRTADLVVPDEFEALLSIAPTGSLSTLMGTSSGIEPYFAFVTKRHIMDKDWIEVAECYENAPDKSVCVTAYDVTPEEHVRVLAACQAVVDNSISKTINMPQNSSKEDVERIYRMAWELGCKGVTIYREGSRFAPLESLKPTDIWECPECHNKQLREGAHCITCSNCGYSMCG